MSECRGVLPISATFTELGRCSLDISIKSKQTKKGIQDNSFQIHYQGDNVHTENNYVTQFVTEVVVLNLRPDKLYFEMHFLGLKHYFLCGFQKKCFLLKINKLSVRVHFVIKLFCFYSNNIFGR